MATRAVVMGAGLIVIVLGGAVVADRLAAATARNIAVREVTAAFDEVDGEPVVAIDGFPFLTQLLAGSLTGVTASVDGLSFDGITVTDVELVAAGITTSEPYTVDHAVLTATLPLATLEDLIAARADVDVTLGVDGSRLTAGTTLLGLEVAAELEPRVADGGLRVDVAGVTLGGFSIDAADLPGGLGDRLRDLRIPIDGLPAGVRLTDVAVVDGGVRLTATGTDVVLTAAAGAAATTSQWPSTRSMAARSAAVTQSP
ncbi:LmeA family phospholipid-binding protein [Pengzhenrongella sicca]|uniref:LmeA family phospholipid-binding protein n=1 Tax=Pengzhenrongella sicca TaxID=2819238 RepID=UPI001D0C9726|nr:DUF2993 domain-containing protein [Pengzhenrongella sicca]